MFPELAKIQKALKVGKNHTDVKGRYTYWKLDDILQAVKPLIPEGCLLTITDTVIEIAGSAFLLSTARWREGGGAVECCGCSQVSTIAENKGMSSPQHTGSAATYARKSALCAMFLLDSGDDPDEINPAQAVPPMPGMMQPPPMPGAYTPPMPGTSPQILYKN